MQMFWTLDSSQGFQVNFFFLFAESNNLGPIFENIYKEL